MYIYIYTYMYIRISISIYIYIHTCIKKKNMLHPYSKLARNEPKVRDLPPELGRGDLVPHGVFNKDISAPYWPLQDII